MNKKLIAINLVIILLISIFSNAVFAASGVDGSQAVPGGVSRPNGDGSQSASNNSCGDNATWQLDDNGTLTISGTGDMYSYTHVTQPWKNARENIKTVVIADGITSISDCAFYGCSNLIAITIPNSVAIVGEYAFLACTGLTNITFPDSINEIGKGAFYQCSNLTDITLCNGVTSIGGHAFYDCNKLENLILPDTICSIGEYAFYNCTSLTSIDIPNSITYLSNNIFNNCENLEDVSLPTNLTTIGYMAFCDCSSLNSITIPEGVTTIGFSAFSGCNNIKNITVPKNVSSIGRWALICGESLELINADESSQYFKSIDGVLFSKDGTRIVQYPSGRSGDYTIPTGVTRIGIGAFNDCTKLTNITIPDGITDIEMAAFQECTSLEKITLPESAVNLSEQLFYMCTNLKEVNIPNGVTAIKEMTFNSCTSLTEVNIPGSVTSIGSRAFMGCDNLINITIPDSVTSIGMEAFKSCCNLTNIIIPDGVTSISDGTFSECSGLTNISISDNVHTIGSNAFKDTYVYDDENWEGNFLYFENFLIQAKTDISGECHVKENTKGIAGSAFSECRALTHIYIPESVTSIGNNAFYNCNNLTSIIIPEGLTSIGGGAFYQCSSLENITIPEGIASIDKSTFFGCYNLKSITLPSTIKTINDYAFSNCDALTDVYYSGTQSQWNNIIIAENNECLLNSNIHFSGTEEVEKHLVVDGVEFNAETNHSGNGWTYQPQQNGGQITLNGYNGGSIYANFDLYIDVAIENESIIKADREYGIYVEGNLGFAVSSNRKKNSKLTVYGSENHEAIYATETLALLCGITAIGDNCRAIYGNPVDISNNLTTFVGKDTNDAVIGEYDEHQYISITDKQYQFSLTLDANGGMNSNGESTHNVIFSSATPATLKLFDYNNLFENGNKKLIGWQDNNKDFYKYNIYTFDAYDFDETLYALWEDEEQKAVYLNNYYMPYSYDDNIELNGGTVIEPVKINEDFVLPNITRLGYILDGWLSSDGTLYKQGDTIKITETISLTAKWSINKDVLVIDGKEYNANEICRGIGWDYHPNLNYTSQRPHIEAQLTIHENYSGLPIVIPKNVYIGINGNVKADELNPAITVYGDVDISLFNHAYETLNDILLRGCGEQPAIKADGAVYLGGIHDSNDSFAIHGGNADTPAIIASKVGFYDKFFYIGTSSDNLTVASSYTNEHILKLVPNGNIYSIMVSKGDIVTTPPQHNDYMFIGWKVTSGLDFVHPNNTLKWYMPGDVVDIDSNNIMLQAAYLDNNRSSVAIALHGNGGATAEGSKYYITLASTARLSLYDIPEKSFTKDGYSFTGFNTVSTGSGTSYTYGDNLNDDGKTFVYNLYAQWKKNETPSNPPSGGGGGGGAPSPSKETIKNDDGSTTTIQTDKKTGTVIEVTKYTDGSTEEIVTQKDGYIKVTRTDNDGNKNVITKNTDGSQTVTTVKKSGVKMDATISTNGETTAKISIPKGTKNEDVVIPAQNLTSGTVAVLIKENGEEEIIANCIVVEDGVLATFEGDATVKIIDNSKEFLDVGNHWANDSVDFVTARGLFNGTSESVFSPDQTMTRGMLAVVLHNYERNPEYSYDGKFSDVMTDSWYGEAVGWLSDKGIAAGYENGDFGAEDSITREQLAVFLYRYAGLPEHSSTTSFDDNDKISNYAIDAISWATENGILNGKENNMLDPQGFATRAEVATMISRFIKNIR